MDAAAAADVENAVRRHFESDGLEFVGGPVLELCASIRALGLEGQSSTTITSLKVVSVGADQADVELDAVGHVVSRNKRGREKRDSASLSGPVRAEREGGEWKVVDHWVDGRRISESFFSLTGEAVRVSGLSLRLCSVSFERQGVRAFVEVENHGAGHAKIRKVSLAVRRNYCAGGQTRSEFAAGSSSTVMLGWQPKSRSSRTRHLRLRVDVQTPDGGHVSVMWSIDLHTRRADGSLRELGRLRVWLASPRAPWVFTGLAFVALVAMIGIPPLKFFVGLGLTLACTMAYVYVHPWLHGR